MIMANENRDRKNQIHLYLNDEEYEQLVSLKNKSGLSASQLIRQLLMECQISEAPTIDFWDMTKQIRYYGNNMNQIAKRLLLFGVPDSEAYQRNADKVFELLEKILSAVLSKKGE